MHSNEVPIPERQRLLAKWIAKNTEKSNSTYAACCASWPKDNTEEQVALYHYATAVYTRLIAKLIEEEEDQQRAWTIAEWFAVIITALAQHLAVKQSTEEYEKSLIPDCEELKRMMEL